MDIDELLKRHPAPWLECPPDVHAKEYNCQRPNCDLEPVTVAAINAYAALKAEADNYREVVKAADGMRNDADRACRKSNAEGFFERMDGTTSIEEYDAARAKVKP